MSRPIRFVRSDGFEELPAVPASSYALADPGRECFQLPRAGRLEGCSSFPGVVEVMRGLCQRRDWLGDPGRRGGLKGRRSKEARAGGDRPEHGSVACELEAI